MKPILYSAEETAFATNGVGILSDVIDCTVIQTLNGQYELEMKYPIKGIHFLEIQQRTIITAKPDPVSDPQPFRVYRITKPLNGVVTIYARHVAYDLMGVTVSPFSANSVVAALQTLKNNAVDECLFSFWTDKETTASMTVTVPSSVWSLLGSTKGSILDCFGGEYEFDKWLIRLYNHRGTNRGVTIRYGKNLTSFEQDENCANCYTGVYPYWTNAEGAYLELPEKIVAASGEYGYTKTMPLDLSSEWQELPTIEQLRTRAKKYIADNAIGEPVVSWKIEFVELEKTEEYRGMALLERVLIGDTVTVEFSQMGVSTSARAVETRYKPVLERYENVSLGSVKANLADTIVSHQKQINSKPNHTQMQMAIVALTAAILGASGGAVRLMDGNGDGMPDTLYIADDPDPAKAIKVWRFNYEGWGASKTGYNGPFIMGATLEGGFLADFITAGTLKSADGNLVFDLENNILSAIGKNENEELMQTTITDGVFRVACYDEENKKFMPALHISAGSDLSWISGANGLSVAGTGSWGTHIGGDDSDTWITGSRVFVHAEVENSGGVMRGVPLMWRKGTDGHDYLTAKYDSE